MHASVSLCLLTALPLLGPDDGGPTEVRPHDDHWAWQALDPPEPPEVSDPDWCTNDIDRFVLSGLEARDLTPVPEADRIALVRRATFDLTGLPPTPAEVTAFLADESPEAWTRLIDRLLESPHYGERWGRHWLDLVRYAETNGFERDSAKPEVWRYRDWVVTSLNEDKPYDRFIVEQIAGDELPDRSAETVAATGMHRLGMWDDEPTDVPQAIADDLDSMLDTTIRATLGVSIGCARCHDHKGDPIPQEDYYRLAAFFSGVKPYRNPTGGTHIATDHVLRDMPVDAAAEPRESRLERYRAERMRLFEALRALERRNGVTSEPPEEGLVAHYAFEGTGSDAAADGTGNHPGQVNAAETTEDGLLGRAMRFDRNEGHVVVERSIGDDFTISLFFRTRAKASGDDRDARWFQGHGLVDGEISGIVDDFGIAMIGNGTVAAGVGRPERFIASPPGFNDGDWHHVAFTRSRETGRARLWVDGALVDETTGGTQSLTSPPRLTIGRMQPDYGAFRGSIDEVRFYDRVLEENEILGLAGRISVDPSAILDRIVGEESAYQADHAALRSMTVPDVRTVRLLSLQERGPVAPETHLLERGSVHAKAALVEPGVPRILEHLAPLPEITPSVHGDSSGRRLALARWITDPGNAATARTAVNRVWHHHFGTGLVPTTSDFGVLGLPPSNAGLIDHLADRFIEMDWSLKDLHRLIMESSTYRMSSVPGVDALIRDPENRFRSRFDLRRLDAEEVRDAMLAASGELSPVVGGPSVRPPLPREILETSSRPDAVWPVTSPEDVGRRSIYISTKRSLLDPLLTVFDAADPDNPCPERFSTTQPTQALTMLNGAFTNDRARGFAERLMLEHPGALEAQVRRGLHLATGRSPDRIEVADGVDFVRELSREEALDRKTALTTFCLVLLNLNEFLHVD